MKKQILLGGCLILLAGLAWAQPHPPPERPAPRREKLREWGEERREEAIKFLSNYVEPEWLEKLKTAEPMKYKGLLRHALREKHELEKLREMDPQRSEIREQCFRLEFKSQVLAEDYRTTKSKSEKKEIKKDLRTLLNELFDLREKDKKFELKRLEKEIEKLREIIKERKKRKSEIIDRHLDELLLEKEYMRW